MSDSKSIVGPEDSNGPSSDEVKAVLKYRVPHDDQWHPLDVGMIVSVGHQFDEYATFWAESDRTRTKWFRTFPTGVDIPIYARHVGSYQQPNGIVVHLYVKESGD